MPVIDKQLDTRADSGFWGEKREEMEYKELHQTNPTRFSLCNDVRISFYATGGLSRFC